MKPKAEPEYTLKDALSACEIIEAEGATIQPEALPALLALIRRVLRVQGLLLAQSARHLAALAGSPLVAALLVEIDAVEGLTGQGLPFEPNVKPVPEKPVPGPTLCPDPGAWGEG